MTNRAPTGVRKESHVAKHLRRMERAGRFGYFILTSMEVGPSFRITEPKFARRPDAHRWESFPTDERGAVVSAIATV